MSKTLPTEHGTPDDPIIVYAGDPGGVTLVSGRHYVMQLRHRAWAPVLTFMSGHNLVTAYNLALFAQLAYEGGRGDPTGNRDALAQMRKPFESMHGTANREAVEWSPLPAEPVLRRVDRAGALRPQSFRFLRSEATETQGYAVAGADYALVAFRGSERENDRGETMLDDWLQNFTFTGRDTPWGPGQIHGGFLSGFESVRGQLDEFLEEFWDPETPVILCGHSLGGALATVAASYVRARHTDRVMLYTYGAPRAGDATFARHFTSTQPIVAHRHVVHLDLVPHLPPPGAELPDPPWVLAPHLVSPGQQPMLLLRLIDVDLDPFKHVGQVRVLSHLGAEGPRSVTVRRPARYVHTRTAIGPSGVRVEVDSEITLSDVLDHVRSRGVEDVLDHLFDDHDMVESYLPILLDELRGGIRAFRAAGPPPPASQADHAEWRADEATLEHQAEAVRARQAAARDRACELDDAAAARASARRRVSDGLPHQYLDELRELQDADRDRGIALTREAAALRNEADGWDGALDAIEALRNLRQSQADGVYASQSQMVGFDPIEGFDDELDRHVE